MASSDPSHLDDEKRTAFANGYRDGRILTDLGEEYGLTAKGVRRLIAELSLEPRQLERTARRRADVDDAALAKLLTAYSAGTPVSDLKLSTGLPLSQIYAALRAHGVSMRRDLASVVDAVSDEDRDEVVRLHQEQGVTAREIGERLQLSLRQVRLVLAESPNRRTPVHLDGSEGEQLRRRLHLLYQNDELSLQQIAERLEISLSSVTRLIRTLDLPRRKRGRKPRDL